MGCPPITPPLIASAAIRSGEHVVHVGAGTGYYTAILAHLVKKIGRVTDIEFDSALAWRAKHNFSGTSNVVVLEGDGASIAFDPADVIYVNAGATCPADTRLDGLNDGGRLILPLTATKMLPGGGTGSARSRIPD